MARYVSVDLEFDHDFPGPHGGSIVSIGAIVVEPSLSTTFYAELKPISDNYKESNLEVCGFTRGQTLTFRDPEEVMLEFEKWTIDNVGNKPIMIADNPCADGSWLNYYFNYFLGRNPYGWSCRRIGDLFCGYMNDPYYRWKQHRGENLNKHNALSDAIANAQALLYLKEQGFNIKLK